MCVLATYVFISVLITDVRAHSGRGPRWGRQPIGNEAIAFVAEGGKGAVNERPAMVVLVTHRLEQVVRDAVDTVLEHARGPFDVADERALSTTWNGGTGHHGREPPLAVDDDFVVRLQVERFVGFVGTRRVRLCGQAHGTSRANDCRVPAPVDAVEFHARWFVADAVASSSAEDDPLGNAVAVSVSVAAASVRAEDVLLCHVVHDETIKPAGHAFAVAKAVPMLTTAKAMAVEWSQPKSKCGAPQPRYSGQVVALYATFINHSYRGYTTKAHIRVFVPPRRTFRQQWATFYWTLYNTNRHKVAHLASTHKWTTLRRPFRCKKKGRPEEAWPDDDDVVTELGTPDTRYTPTSVVWVSVRGRPEFFNSFLQPSHAALCSLMLNQMLISVSAVSWAEKVKVGVFLNVNATNIFQAVHEHEVVCTSKITV